MNAQESRLHPQHPLRFLFLIGLAAFVAQDARAEGFIAASAGRSNWDVDCSGQLTCDKHGNAGTVRLGWQLMRYLAVEARYFDLGKASATFQSGINLPDGTPIVGATDLTAKGFGVDAMAVVPFGERFSVSAMAGVARAEAKTNIETHSNVFNVSATTTNRASKPYYGLGIGFAVTPQLAITLEAERYRIAMPTETLSIDMLGAGLTYRFR